MGKSLLVVADADAVVAQASPNDNLHQKAVKTAEKLKQLNAKVLYPITAVTEAVTHIQRVLSSGATAYGVAVNFTDPNTNIIGVDQRTLNNAVNFFSPDTSKKNTLYDCIVAAVAEEQNADAIFSFDKFYKSQGFKLATEL